MTPEEMRYLLSCGANPLELSIAKWADIANGVGEDEMSLNCALCNVNRFCSACLIAKEVNEINCEATPYVDYDENPTTENAIKEMQFLQGLR